MASSPKKKRLNLNLKVKQKNKEKIEERMLSSTDSTNSKKNNFMKACSKVSYEAYQDYKKRFQLMYLPGCIDNMCNHGDRNANIKQISLSAEQSFETEFKNSAWYEALEICIVCITSCNYLSANILKNIVEIMMNAHDDTGYTIDYILRKCQHTLMMHFNMHPPCVGKKIRNCYKDFLMSPMDTKEFSNRKEYLSDEGIISHCFSRLIYEISVESKDGTIIEEQEIPTEVEGVKRLHWKKENLQLYELLVRKERIERCMLVLETVIYLLQTDIALWDARCRSSMNPVRSQRLLLGHILWPYSCIAIGTVSALCHKIMKLFAYYIHLQYPERHIKTMGLWLNAVVQMLYGPHHDYPHRSTYIVHFTKEFYKVISPLPSSSISRILEKIQPTFMQYLVGLRHLHHLLDTEVDILNIIIFSFDTMLWEHYSTGDQELTNFKKTRLKPGKLMGYLCKKCKSFSGPINVAQDAYPKFELEQNNAIISKNHMINTLFRTFVAYLEAYSVKTFNQTLDWYNENEDNCDVTSYNPVSDEFVKQYRSIIKSLQELFVILTEKQSNESLQKLSELINIYFSL